MFCGISTEITYKKAYMNTKHLSTFVLTIVLVFGFLFTINAQGYKPTTYFTTEEMPDLIQCLPAPPDSTSEAFSYDILRYMWGKLQRYDVERADMAKRDAVWSYEALLAEMSVPFGLEISEKGTPEIWKLLTNSLATTDQMRVAPKAYYNRTRPFVYFHEEPFMESDKEFANEGSYPSGHTMRCWTAALLLSEINPEASAAIFSRAWLYCENRVITGAHWQSDIDATRSGASIGYARLQTSSEFQKQMAKAQKEFKRLIKK
jgi:acid phosphatase (class A)